MEEKKKKSVLGRGLGAILPTSADSETVSTSSIQTAIQEIPLEQIEPNPYQPRVDFDEQALDELAQSIIEQGIIQPITLRKLSENSYQIISGERRFRAAKKAGLTAIPAYIRTADNEQMLEMAIIENVQRQDLNAIEIAIGYKRLMEECRLTLEQVAQKVGKSRPNVNNYVRLLKLPPEIQVAIRDGLLSMGHARALITLDNPVMQLSIFKQIIDKQLSVRQVEKLIQEFQNALQEKSPKKSVQNLTPLQIHLKDIEVKLSKRFNTKVSIHHKDDDKGEVRLVYYSKEDLDRLLELLNES